MKSKEWAVIGSFVGVALVLVVMLLINISPNNDVNFERETGPVTDFIPDRQITFGTIGPNQTISKSIAIDSVGILRGAFKINLHGLANVTYGVTNPDNSVMYGQGTIYSAILRIEDEDEFFVIRMDNSPAIPQDMDGRLVFANYARVQDVADLNLTNSIVLAERSGRGDEIVYLYEKETNVANKGAIMLVVYNDQPGIFLGQLIGNEGYSAKIPVVSMSREDGLMLKELAASNVIASITADSDFRTDVSVSTPRFRLLAYEPGSYTLLIYNEGPGYIDATFDYIFTESK